MVVVGGANVHYATLKAALRESQVLIRLVRNAANMPELMAWADMAIISGGTTSYETAFMGLPCMIVIIAENQVRVAERFAEIGAAANLGWHNDLSRVLIQRKVEDLRINCRSRQSMSRISRQLVDGQGASRVIRAMLERMIPVRDAVESDCEQVYEWANDEATRAASFDSGPIAWNSHQNWFEERLQNPNCLLLVCGNDRGQSLGLVRFDLAGDKATISINLDPRMRGQGLASFIIVRAVDELFKRCGILQVSAFIKPQNLLSARAFVRAGFSDVGPTNIRGHKACQYVINRGDSTGQ